MGLLDVHKKLIEELRPWPPHLQVIRCHPVIARALKSRFETERIFHPTYPLIVTDADRTMTETLGVSEERAKELGWIPYGLGDERFYNPDGTIKRHRLPEIDYSQVVNMENK